MSDSLVVGLAEVKWSVLPEDVLVAFSLGSCVGVALWDPVLRAGAMAHVMLPSSRGRKSPKNGVDAGLTPRFEKPGKYADTAVEYAVRCLTAIGAEPSRMMVRMAGGAHVIPGFTLPGGDIGTANIRAVSEAIERLGLPEPRKDVGGDYGRTMRLYVGEGRATVYSVSRGEREI
ncbi:MAG: chemotaxis protein CheD [Bacillota bacterium]|jgi:chemotaxis protein CheD|nr:chemotaxis protein CheD [Candidatus Fermentithermobacillaceae bacterium]